MLICLNKSEPSIQPLSEPHGFEPWQSQTNDFEIDTSRFGAKCSALAIFFGQWETDTYSIRQPVWSSSVGTAYVLYIMHYMNINNERPEIYFVSIPLLYTSSYLYCIYEMTENYASINVEIL